MFSNILSKLFRSQGDDIARGVANSASRGLGKSALSNLGREIADDATQSVVKKGGFLNSVADLLEKSGETAMNTGRSVTRAGMAKVAPDAKHNIAEVFRRTGISDPGAQAELGRTLTGTEDAILDKAINSTRSATDVLDMTHFDLPTREYEAVLNSFPSNLRPLIDHYTPVQMEKLLKSEGSGLMYTANKAGDKTLGGLMMDMGDKIATGIDNAVEQVRPGATQELYENSINELKRLAGEARLQNNTPFMKAYDKLAQELEATPAAERTIANLRSFKRDFVNGEKLERLSDQAQGGGALLGNSGGGRGMGGMPKGLTNLLDTLVGTPAQAATGKLGSTLVSAADKLRDESVQKAIKRGAAAVGGIGALSMLGDQLGGRRARGASMPGDSSGADGMGSAVGGVTGNPRDVSNGLATTVANSANNDTIAGYSREDLENAYVKALMDGNTKAGKSIASIIDLLDSRTKAATKASTAKSGAADAKTAAKQNTARTQMSNLMKLYRQAGGGHGVGGHLTNALNAITADSVNPAAGAYNSQRQALAVALARASGDSGTLSDMDIKSYMSMVPDIADNPTKARLKIQSIYNMLGQ